MLRILVAVAALTCVDAFADICVEPPAPADPPSGATATREEMRAVQEMFKAYNTAVVQFSACIDKNNGSPARADNVVRRLERLADKVNAEVRAFRQRNAS